MWNWHLQFLQNIRKCTGDKNHSYFPNMLSYCISVRETNVFLKMEHIKYILQHLNEVVLEYLWFQYKLCVVL